MHFLRAIVPIFLSALALYSSKNKIKCILMKFFRDLARFKARKRLYGNQQALIPLLLGREKPIDIAVADSLIDSFTMNREDLARMNGQEDSPIYIGINGLIFDVTTGKDKYGPGMSYHFFAGKDATIPIGKGCMSQECLDEAGYNLTDSEQKEVDRWIEFYHTHDKYQCIGRLVEDPVDSVVNSASMETSKDNDTSSTSSITEDSGDEDYDVKKPSEAVEL
jgi:membrane-associated progesterone receptor component